MGPEPAAGGGRFSLRDDGLRLPPPSPHMHAAGRPRLDLSTPLEACGAIRVALLPVGAIDAASFRRYARLCAAHASQLELAEITHGQARVSVLGSGLGLGVGVGVGSGHSNSNSIPTPTTRRAACCG